MSSNDHALGKELEQKYEKRPDSQALTGHADPSKNSASGVDYEPHPEHSIKLEPEREKIVQSICNLYVEVQARTTCRSMLRKQSMMTHGAIAIRGTRLLGSGGVRK